MSELNIQKWLSNITQTIQTKDLDKHMELVSENVMVYGLPDEETLNYSGWIDRYKSEFQQDFTKKLSYDNLKIRNLGLRRLSFTVQEIMVNTSNDSAVINKMIVLEQEQDNEWRIVEESIQN